MKIYNSFQMHSAMTHQQRNATKNSGGRGNGSIVAPPSEFNDANAMRLIEGKLDMYHFI